VTDRNGNPRPYEAADAQKIRPAKDSVKFEGEVRLPFRRLFDSPPTGFWDLGPVARVTYETQLWPATWLTSMPENLWPHRVNDLRALVGISAKPLASDETLRLGMLFDYDFSRTTPTQSFAYGLEVGGQGKWNRVYDSSFRLQLQKRLVLDLCGWLMVKWRCRSMEASLSRCSPTQLSEHV
jgi:hypothetical protein